LTRANTPHRSIKTW